MELGLFSFVENTPQAPEGIIQSPEDRIDDLLEEIALADELGLDFFGIGEHHREEYISSAPSVILAAAAARTRRIRLGSAVTVLGSEDPVRVYQQFATLDLISKGRAEIIAGRGSFIESFPLFGYELENYDEIFAEKLDLLLTLRESETVSWQGSHRPSIDNRGIYPQPVQDQIPIWIAVGGTPQSAFRAGYLGLPLALAIIGGEPARFQSFVDIHRQGLEKGGHGPRPVSINSHGFIADTTQEALDLAYPAFKTTMDRIGRERGWPPMTRSSFEASCGLRQANAVGSPQQIIDKILYQHEILGHDRYALQMSVGTIPHDKMMRSIELFATEVAPAVRKELADRKTAEMA